MREAFEVVAPTGLRDKARPEFTAAWRRLGIGAQQLTLL